jgi:hypothetical protein
MVARFGMPPADMSPGFHAVARSGGRITLDDGAQSDRIIMAAKIGVLKIEKGFIFFPPYLIIAVWT